MEIRSLVGVGWDALAWAFNAAFSDYAVAMAMTPEALANMQLRRGYVAEASFGAYEGAQLIGFVLTCRDGDRIYNSGTGVVPARRRSGLARALLDAVTGSVEASSYVLEVLEPNTGAIALYQAAGFVETRRLQCWTYDRRGDELPAIVADLAAIAAHADIEPAWQNSVASLRRAPEPSVVIGDAAGAAVVFPGSADLALLAVARDARRRGHGRRLLAAAAARASRPLRILNVDARDAGIAAFLAAAGAEPLVRQIEMVRAR
jgi:ribosomal protein S18 acetylase RimI-like enzyme